MTATLTSKVQLVTIESIAIHRVRVPLVEPFRISNGAVTEKDAILVEARTKDGVVGWGEASPMSGSFYSVETPDSAWQALTADLIPEVLDAGAFDVTNCFERTRNLSDNAFAKAGLEGALWDAYANTRQVPLWQLLGAQPRSIPSGVAIGIYDQVDELLERVERYVSQGYKRVKIKIEPGWDVEPVAAILARFSDVPLMVDANGAYSIDDLEVFRELDTYSLMMIEQPFARAAHAESAELQRQLRTPICADESAESMEALESLIAEGAAQIINIKLQRVGGLSEGRLMLERARSAGLECWVGTMPELGVASAQGLHFAALDGFSYPTDIEASSRWYVDDVIEPQIEIDRNGFIEIPVGNGMGYRVSREKVQKYSIDKAEFAA